jgi:hypothetical protein
MLDFNNFAVCWYVWLRRNCDCITKACLEVVIRIVIQKCLLGNYRKEYNILKVNVPNGKEKKYN